MGSFETIVRIALDEVGENDGKSLLCADGVYRKCVMRHYIDVEPEDAIIKARAEFPDNFNIWTFGPYSLTTGD